MLYPVLQDPLRPVVSSLFDRPVGLSIRQMLFGAGEQGGWYDVSDMSTLFQDAAGTTPVTAVEQPVGRILDLSERGNHATQATTTKRPTLKQDANGCYYLSFDGVDDAMQTGNINLTSTDKMTVWAGVNSSVSQDGTRLGTILLHPDTGFSSFTLNSPYAASNLAFGATTNSAQALAATTATSALNNNAVLTGAGDLLGRTAHLRVNGLPLTSATAASGGGNFRSGPLYIGWQVIANRHFNGRLYSLIVRGAQSSLSQIEAAERYIKQKMRLP